GLEVLRPQEEFGGSGLRKIPPIQKVPGLGPGLVMQGRLENLRKGFILPRERAPALQNVLDGVGETALFEWARGILSQRGRPGLFEEQQVEKLRLGAAC